MGLTYTHTFSVTELRPTLYNPTDCGMPGLPVHHQLPEFTKTHVHWVGDAIQPSHSLLHPSPSAFNLFQHQGLFNTYTQFSSVAQSCPTLCDPMNHSTPGLPVPHQLLGSTQTHVHWVSDAIQPSQPLSSPSSPAPNPSQHQGLFQWVNSSHEVAKVLEFQLQHQSFQWTPRTDLFQDGLVGSPCSPRDSQESSPTPQFKSINSSALSFIHSPTLASIHDHWKNHSLD